MFVDGLGYMHGIKEGNSKNLKNHKGDLSPKQLAPNMQLLVDHTKLKNILHWNLKSFNSGQLQITRIQKYSELAGFSH